MWRRLRTRTLSPRRPAVFPEQWGLAMVTAMVVLGGIVAVFIVL